MKLTQLKPIEGFKHLCKVIYDYFNYYRVNPNFSAVCFNLFFVNGSRMSIYVNQSSHGINKQCPDVYYTSVESMLFDKNGDKVDMGEFFNAGASTPISEVEKYISSNDIDWNKTINIMIDYEGCDTADDYYGVHTKTCRGGFCIFNMAPIFGITISFSNGLNLVKALKSLI